MLARRMFFAFSKTKSKTSPNVITADSNIIVDHLAFTQTDVVSRIMNWLRTSNASSELMRNMDGKFKKHTFEEEALKKYVETYQCYQNRNYRDMFNYVGNTLLTVHLLLFSLSKPKQKRPKTLQISTFLGI